VSGSRALIRADAARVARFRAARPDVGVIVLTWPPRVLVPGRRQPVAFRSVRSMMDWLDRRFPSRGS
jgi:hypothetical protein